MNDPRHIPVFGREGRLGWLEPTAGAGEPAAGSDAAIPSDGEDRLVRLEDGTLIQVPSDLLVQQSDGSYFLPMTQSQFEGISTGSENRSPVDQGQRLMVIPVIAEDVQVSKRRTTRSVRVHKTVSQHEEVVDQPGFQEEVSVERVPINQFVDTAPKARYENNTLVIPVMEEVLVVEKRLVLKEEVRVTRRRTATRNPQRVTLRTEAVQVERPESVEEEHLGAVEASPQDHPEDRLQDHPIDQEFGNTIQGETHEGSIK